ncbi:uncharacterized protein [Aristolochia californica]|uniref:uncharacterized protein n=1 Tax=Aristolochia californica TaxID=171875 RepID=UPI0035D95AAA
MHLFGWAKAAFRSLFLLTTRRDISVAEAFEGGGVSRIVRHWRLVDCWTLLLRLKSVLWRLTSSFGGRIKKVLSWSHWHTNFLNGSNSAWRDNGTNFVWHLCAPPKVWISILGKLGLQLCMAVDLLTFSKSLMGTSMSSLGKMMLSACSSFIPVVGHISTWLLTKKSFSPYLGSSIRENWRNLALIHIGKKSPVMQEWTPPTPGYLKLNFDGSSLSNPGISGYGGVISDHSGNQLFTYAGPFGISDSTTAELQALVSDLRVFKDRCSGPLQVEGDSKVVIG